MTREKRMADKMPQLSLNSSRCHAWDRLASCSRFCCWNGWIKCAGMSCCAAGYAASRHLRSVHETTILMAMVATTRRSIQRERRCSVSLSAHQDPRQRTTCSVIPKRLMCSYFDGARRSNCLMKGDTVVDIGAARRISSI